MTPKLTIYPTQMAELGETLVAANRSRQTLPIGDYLKARALEALERLKDRAESRRDAEIVEGYFDYEKVRGA